MDRIIEPEEKQRDDGNVQDNFDFKWRSLVALISILFFLMSFDCDLVLASAYFEREMYREFSLTISITVTASLVIGSLSTFWIIQNSSAKKSPPGIRYILCILTRFPWSGLARDADILGRWIIKIDDSDHEKFLQINREARTLRLYDAMLGNAAQFLLQSYFYLTKFKEIDAYLNFLYCMSVISSFVIVVWSVTTYTESSNRDRGVATLTDNNNKDNNKDNNNTTKGLVTTLLDIFSKRTYLILLLLSNLTFVATFLVFSWTTSHNYHYN